MKIIKRLLKLIIISITIVITLILYDFYVQRGYISLNYIILKSEIPYNYPLSDDTSIIEYKITKQKDNNFLFEIKNNSFLPFTYLGYLDSNSVYSFNDTLLFPYAFWKKINLPYKKHKRNYGFSCGTGLGFLTINPKETFKTEIKYKEILDNFSLNELIQDHNNQDSIYYSIINKKKLYSTSSNYTLIFYPENVNIKDSISVQFFMRVNSIFTKKSYDIKSNMLTISYNDLLENHSY